MILASGQGKLAVQAARTTTVTDVASGSGTRAGGPNVWKSGGTARER